MKTNVIIGLLAILCNNTSAFCVTPLVDSQLNLQHFRRKKSVRCAYQHHHSRDDKQNEGGNPSTSPIGRARCAAMSESSNAIGRRDLIRGLVLSSIFKSTDAHADASHTTLNPAVRPAICDSTVESYRKGSKQIHIVGTAHISFASSKLSGSSVRETKVRYYS